MIKKNLIQDFGQEHDKKANFSCRLAVSKASEKKKKTVTKIFPNQNFDKTVVKMIINESGKE